MPLMNIKDAITLLHTYEDQNENILIVWQRESQGIDEPKVKEWTDRASKRAPSSYNNTRDDDWPVDY